MTMTKVGECRLCGSPIYQPTVWMSILPPPSQNSCGCMYRQPQECEIYVHSNIPEHSQVKYFNPKVEIIKALKRYKEDTTTKAEEAAFEVVIDWFINCTPDYNDDE